MVVAGVVQWVRTLCSHYGLKHELTSNYRESWKYGGLILRQLGLNYVIFDIVFKFVKSVKSCQTCKKSVLYSFSLKFV